MEAFTDPAVRELWVMKSAQIAWTTMIENMIGFHVHQDPAPILLVQPTLDLAEAFSKDRLAPMIRDTPALHGRIADVRSRDSGNTLLHKKFPGGHLTLAGANAASGLRARPIRIALFDEIDAYPASAGTEGNPISLGKKRQTAFWNRRTAGGSTPTIKGASEIERRFDGSDQRYFFVPCVHCGHKQRLVWAQVKWVPDQPETARYQCERCAVLWSDGERMESVRRGEWQATKPFNGVAGFHINEIYSPFVRLEEMVRNFLEAKKLPETLQTFINTSLAQTWEQSGSTIEPGSLLERRETYGPESIPDEALLLTAGVDVQDDRVEVLPVAWGADEQSWPIEQKVFRGDPGKAELWKEVDEYLRQTFTTEVGRTLRIDAACVDSGGHHTQDVYHFVVSRKQRRVWAVKGLGGAGKLAWPKKASRTPKSRAKVYLIGVDAIKSVLYGRLANVLESGPGYVHLPASADEEFCKQLTSEKAITKYVGGRPRIVWEPRAKNIAQEVQDCWLYAYAAMLGRGGPQFLTRLGKRPSVSSPPDGGGSSTPPPPKDPEPSPPAPAQQHTQAPTRSTGWMGRGRGWMKRR